MQVAQPMATTAIGIVAILFLTIPGFTHGQLSPCPAGTAPATAEDVPKMISAGIPGAKVGMCWHKGDEHVGSSVADVKAFLEKRACAQTISTGYHATYCPDRTRPIRFDGLDTKFAQCLKSYIEKYEAAHGPNSMCIRDAYRTNGDQRCAAANSANGNAVAAPGNSRHERGQAVDINPKSPQTYATLRRWTDSNERNLWFRYACAQAPGTGGGGLNDCPHVEARDLGAANCAGGGQITPVPSTPPNVAGTGTGNVPTGGTNQTGGTRTAMTNNPFANPYNPTQQSMPTSYSSYPTPTPYPTDTTSYNSPTPVSVPAPTTGVATMPPLYVPPSNTSIQTGAPQTTSDYDKLKQLASTSQSTGTSVSTGTSLNGSASSTRLNGDLYDIDYGGSHTGGANIEVETLAVMATSSVAINPVHVTQTFSGTNAPPQTAGTDVRTAQNQSLVVALLTTLRDLLVSYLKFLQTRTTYGFQRAWQPAQTGAVYR